MQDKTSQHLPSLIQPEHDQPVLFSDFGEAGETAQRELSAKREHTAANLYSSDPQRYRLVIELLGRGMSQRTIAQVCRVSHNTIRAIQRREGAEVDTIKSRISLQLKQFAGIAVERLIDEAHDIPLNQLAVALGIAIDKAQLLDGEPTSITQATGKTIEDFHDAYDALPSAAGRVIEHEPPAIGFEGDMQGQRDPIDALPDGGQTNTVDRSESGADDVAGDSMSHDSDDSAL